MQSQPVQGRSYRYFDFVVAAFVTVLLCSNLVGAAKVTTLFGFTMGAGIFFFPLSYIFNDILTEVYGYAHSRRAVWAGLSAQVFASLMCWFIVTVPPAEGFANQAAIETVFGQTPRIVLASIFAFFVGEFANSYVLAKIKIKTNGRFLFVRTIGSTIVGEAFDSLLFYPIAFYGVWSNDLLLTVLTTNYALKVLVEVVMTPATYRIVAFLKRAEAEDYYDRKTDFNPFKI